MIRYKLYPNSEGEASPVPETSSKELNPLRRPRLPLHLLLHQIVGPITHQQES
jgi:hypothetical protein